MPIAAETSRQKRAAAWLSVAANSGALVLKLGAAVLTGSSAVLSEAAHSFADLTASVIALVSVRAADRPADPGHPFGHEKIEHVSGVVEGAMILVTAVGVAVLAITHLGNPIAHSGWGIAVMLVTATGNIIVGRRVRAVGAPRTPRPSRPTPRTSRHPGPRVAPPHVSVTGEQRLADGSVRALDRDSLTMPLDAGGLRGLSVAVPLLAVAALVLRI